MTGLLRLRPLLVPVAAALMWALSIGYEFGVNVVLGDDLMRMVFVFFVGATAHLYAHRIPMNAWIALVAVDLPHQRRHPGELPPTGHGTAGLCPAVVQRLLPLSLRADLSYGVYIYHWPILQLIATTTLVGQSASILILIGLLVTGVVAAGSWLLVENEALARKHNAVPDQVETTLRRATARYRRAVMKAGQALTIRNLANSTE